MIEPHHKPDRQKVILVAEDDDYQREFISSALAKSGYEVLSCSDGFEAVLKASNRWGTIDLLLADMRMPVMDGITSAKIIARDRPEIKIIFMSASNASGPLDGNIDHITEFIDKPFDEQRLLKTIEKVLVAK